ncbi:MAG: RNA polymerase sigma factor [Acidobacteriota bacterium]|nr:RNA polymerase sigma factor [Acidobacteriota bacterium]
MSMLEESTLMHTHEGRAESALLERELESFHDASFGWALACCGRDRDAAQDVLQTAYLRVIEGRARFLGDATLRTWFFGVVRKVAAERRRRHAVRGAALLRWFGGTPQPPVAATPETSTTDAQRNALLHDGLARLSSRQRELLHLVFYQELTVEEAANVLGITVGSARTHYARGKTRLKTWLSGAGVEPS